MATPNPLDGIVDLLDRADSLAKKVRNPVNQVNSDLESSCSCVDNVQEFISDLNSLSSLISYIGRMDIFELEIPGFAEAGAIMVSLNKFICKLLDPINKFKKDVLDKVQKILNDLYKVTSKVNDAVNMFATK